MGLFSIHTVYLANDSAPVTSPTITCRDPGSNGEPHTDWSLSPGGGSQSASILDTSPAKYTVSGNRLTISNVDGTDEGLYRCVYENGGTVENACIYVYGKFIQI